LLVKLGQHLNIHLVHPLSSYLGEEEYSKVLFDPKKGRKRVEKFLVQKHIQRIFHSSKRRRGQGDNKVHLQVQGGTIAFPFPFDT